MGQFPSGDPASTMRVGRICSDTWELAKCWLADCQDSHRHCSKSVVDYAIPTRLVYVGFKDKDIRLRISQDLLAGIKYLTLSHRWGDKAFKTLTRDNLAPFLSRIPVEIFNKTFHEGMVTTRRLGFQYIWIDSLCIIQDDFSDWQHESVKMGSVYANSTLNMLPQMRWMAAQDVFSKGKAAKFISGK
jgi:hypothetical protein